jgi:hypothetical protein
MHMDEIFHGKLNYRASMVVGEEISKFSVFENFENFWKIGEFYVPSDVEVLCHMMWWW